MMPKTLPGIQPNLAIRSFVPHGGGEVACQETTKTDLLGAPIPRGQLPIRQMVQIPQKAKMSR